MSDKGELFGGFDALAASLLNKKTAQAINPNMNTDDDIPFLEDIPSDDNDPILEDMDDNDTQKDTIIDNEETDPIEETDPVGDDNEEVDDPAKDDEPADTDQGLTDADEKEVTQYFQEQLFNKFGWEITDEDRFEKVEDFIDYLSKVIEDNSKPEFANTEVAALNDYAKQGGDLKKYFQTIDQGIDPEEIDLKTESNQILAIRESLRLQGHDNNKINKRIARYSDTGILEDEAEEALDYLKGYKKQTQEKLFREQEIFHQEELKKQQKFYTDVKQEVEGLNDILGIPLQKAEKNSLIEYIFKRDVDGMTKYQKEYSSSVRNLVESAYFTKMRDRLSKKINVKANSDATVNLRKKLEMRTKRVKDIGDAFDSKGKTTADYGVFDSFASQIAKPKFL